ncbi:histidine kinase dimerization/phosphoacceptor domain -containing protein (plasmid) [Bradyrhizobium sp. PMVTL-01]|uniref:histidine kinase dimerization/phosphoacceptor domain -containing protein n=1 Tax=Bradyrhizobium sp. PMVTL-01 TaxID=3434999 RepID=UPI003F701489
MLADKTNAVLLQEMAHRTKNNLAILSGMIRLEARHGGPEVAAALEATARRLQVMRRSTTISQSRRTRAR